MADNRTNDRSI